MTEEKEVELKEEEKIKKEKEEKRKKEEVKQKIKEEFEILKKKLEEKTNECEEYKELAQRIKAEFDNYRKRILKENEERVKLANENLIMDLLPILDSFDFALNLKENFNDTKFESFYNGVKIIYDNLINLLKGYGLEIIAENDGVFNPLLYEAVAKEEDLNVNEIRIKEILSKGYKLGEKILRAAKVKVLVPSTNTNAETKNNIDISVESNNNKTVESNINENNKN